MNNYIFTHLPKKYQQKRICEEFSRTALSFLEIIFVTTNAL